MLNATRGLIRLIKDYQKSILNDPRTPIYREPRKVNARLQRMAIIVSTLIKQKRQVIDNQSQDWKYLEALINQIDILLDRHKPKYENDAGFSAGFLYKIDSIINDVQLLMMNSSHNMKPYQLGVCLQVILKTYMEHYSGPDTGPVHLKNVIKQALLQKSFDKNEKNPILDASQLLSRLGLHKERAHYIRRIINPNTNKEDLIGLIFEMKGLLHINDDPDLQILETNFNIRKKGTNNTMEFFDVIACSKSSGKLIFYEIKGENNYSLIRFIEQFLGRYMFNNFLEKPLCQIDVLIQPNQFIPLNSLNGKTLAQNEASSLNTSDYKDKIESGEIEIRVLTPHVLRRLKSSKIYEKDQTLGELMTSLPRIALRSFSLHDPFRPTTAAIESVLNSRIREIQEERPQLLQVPIRFETMQLGKKVFPRGCPEYVG